MTSPVPPLNPFQQNRLLASFRHVDRLLSEIESIMGSEPQPLFPRYVADVSLDQRQVIGKLLGDIRRSMASALGRQDMPVPEPPISALHAIRTNLDYADIAAEEMGPRYMKGYGDVSEAARPYLEQIVGELQALIRTLVRYLGERR